MGFECVFHYFEKNQDGKGFDTTNKKTFKKIIGKTEDVSLEDLASIVLKQLARRDVLVDDVELYEFTKKSISFKETKGGVVIKGQKFDLSGIKLESSPEATKSPESIQPIIQDLPMNNEISSISLREKLGMSTQNNVTPSNGSVLRMEIFDPDDDGIVKRLQNKGMSFVVGKKYPIFKEDTKIMNVSENGVSSEQEGYVYTVGDDNGKSVVLPSGYFRPEIKLSYVPQGYNNIKRNGNGAKLLYMNNSNDDMPHLRRGV